MEAIQSTLPVKFNPYNPFFLPKTLPIASILKLMMISCIAMAAFKMLTNLNNEPLTLNLLKVSIIVAMICVAVIIKNSRSTLKEALKNKNGLHVFDKDVVLILASKKDHNGALSYCNSKTLSNLLNQKTYEVVFTEINSSSDIYKSIWQVHKNGNRIKLLWITAHGNKRYIGPITNKFGEVFICKTSLSLLERDAIIILDGCSTGKKDKKGRPNIAETIAEAAVGRHVYAPIKETDSKSLKITFEPYIQIRFKRKGKDISVHYCN